MPGGGSDLQAPTAAADYDLLERQVTALLEGERDFIANAANFAALLYNALPLVNWAGFYFPDPGGLVLGPFGGKPACTRLPKGRGVCGKAFERAETVVVHDVSAEPGHIACDSESRSELVVPLLHGDAIFGVFDLDSPVLSRFTQRDKTGVESWSTASWNVRASRTHIARNAPVQTASTIALTSRLAAIITSCCDFCSTI